MNHFLISFCLITSLLTAQNSNDVSLKWESPVTIFSDSVEVKALSFEGAFYHLNESSFPFYQEKPI